MTQRRTLLACTSAMALASLLPAARAQQPTRRFELQPGAWRSFEVTTTVELKNMKGPAKVWVPIPVVDAEYQRSHESTYSGNARSARVLADARYGAKMVYAEFADAAAPSLLTVTSRIDTRDRATDWSRKGGAQADLASLRYWTQPSERAPFVTSRAVSRTMPSVGISSVGWVQ